MAVSVIDYQSQNAAEDFARGLRETGFAVLKNHPVDDALLKRAYSEWQAFFNGEDKHNYPYDEHAQEGYVSTELSETAKGNDKKDLKEFYHYYSWSRCPKGLEEVTAQTYSALTGLAAELLGWIEAHLPEEYSQQLSEPLSNMIKDSPNSLLRPIHYPPLTGNEEPGALRAAAHEDINLLTILPAATADGLEVKDANGNWLPVPTGENWIIINAADMLQECTKGYYKSTSHRVTNPQGEAAKKSRISMPLFLHPRDEVVLSERHTRKSYLEERLRELGLLKS